MNLKWLTLTFIVSAMSNDVLIESYMLRICEKYRLKHIEEFTVDEITRELDPELTGLGKKVAR
jgi:hypothetical protein